MNGLVLLVISMAVLGAAYLLYGRWLARKWGVDPALKTPAQEREDGMEYVPTSPAVVFGHEFASIAGAGPINGPIIAAAFGWLPVLLWLLFGSIFFGAVHDFAALYTSVKNRGESTGFIIERYVGKGGKRLFLVFVWLFSVLIAGAFADIAAGTFTGLDSAGRNQTNASVASTSALFIAAAAGLGFLIRKRRASDLASAIVAIDLLILCIVLGIFFPVYLSHDLWLYLVFAYIFVASVVPVWLLGQPRNYLNSFLLVAMIIAAFVGVVFTQPVIDLPAFRGFEVNGNFLFPGLFITIACGAISGFHSLVATGSTSRQIISETHMLPVSYGAMLVETLVAVLALISVGSLSHAGVMPSQTPVWIFATGVSRLLHRLGLPSQVSFTIVSLAVSSFVLTTLDTVARLGRLAFHELFHELTKGGAADGGGSGAARTALGNFAVKVLGSKSASSFFTLLPAYLLAVLGYQTIWALFGAANQLLAALALLACMLFMKKSRRAFFMLVVPTVIMLAVTFSSLAITIYRKLAALAEGKFDLSVDGLQLLIASLLLVLGVLVALSCARRLPGRDDALPAGAEQDAGKRP